MENALRKGKSWSRETSQEAHMVLQVGDSVAVEAGRVH